MPDSQKNTIYFFSFDQFDTTFSQKNGIEMANIELIMFLTL